MYAKGRIGHGGSHHPWLSRDYTNIDCRATGCLFNKRGKCMTPASCEIDETGKCKGFMVPPQKKVEGD